MSQVQIYCSKDQLAYPLYDIFIPSILEKYIYAQCLFAQKINVIFSPLQMRKSRNKTLGNNQSASNIAAIIQQNSPKLNIKFQFHDSFRQKFNRNIEHAVQIYEQLYENKMPQKCLLHNMNYTLYCENQHKMLCSKCMYKNSAHQLHSVKPLANCVDMLEKDCEKAEKQVFKVIQHGQKLTAYLNDQIQQIEKQFPIAKGKIEDIFKILHQLLFDQQKQCIKELRIFKATLLEQKNALNAEIKKVSLFVNQQLQKYGDKCSTQEFITRRNIYQSLKTSIKLINEQLKIDVHSTQQKFKFNEKMIEQIKQFYETRFKNWFPWNKNNNKQPTELKIKYKVTKEINTQNKNSNKKLSKSFIVQRDSRSKSQKKIKLNQKEPLSNKKSRLTQKSPSKVNAQTKTISPSRSVTPLKSKTPIKSNQIAHPKEQKSKYNEKPLHTLELSNKKQKEKDKNKFEKQIDKLAQSAQSIIKKPKQSPKGKQKQQNQKSKGKLIPIPIMKKNNN